MITNFNWKKGIFSNTYEIYSEGNLVGNLYEKTFSKISTGILNHKNYTFKTNGVLKQNTDIFDNTENKQIGKIEYNNWMTKATITINNKTIFWKYDNIWNTKWSLYDLDGNKINFAGSMSKGKIETDLVDEAILLSGLFVSNYYWQMTIVVLVIALMPIWINIIN